MSGIIDSSILIDCLRGNTNALTFLSAQSLPGPPRTHLLVAAELLTGARDKNEMNLIDSFLRSFELVIPTDADSLNRFQTELLTEHMTALTLLNSTAQPSTPARRKAGHPAP